MSKLNGTFCSILFEARQKKNCVLYTKMRMSFYRNWCRVWPIISAERIQAALLTRLISYLYIWYQWDMPFGVAARSKAWVCGRSLARMAGSNLAGNMCVSVCFECCVLSGRGLCDGLITRPEESHQVSVCI